MRKSLEELAREITANTIHLISGEDIKNVVASYMRDLLPEGHVLTRDGQDVVIVRVVNSW